MENPYTSGAYLSTHQDWHEADAPWKAQQVGSMIQAHHLMPTSVCDVGCGTGAVLENLVAYLPETTRRVGYDIARASLELAKVKRSPGLEMIHGDILETQEKFDLILLIDVFEHVEDYLGFLRALRGHGSNFIFHIPLDMNVQMVARSKPILKARSSVGHLHYFSKDTALATLGDTGYRVIDYRYTAGGLDLPNRNMKQRVLKVPRTMALKAVPDLAVRLLGGYSLLVLAS